MPVRYGGLFGSVHWLTAHLEKVAGKTGANQPAQPTFARHSTMPLPHIRRRFS